MNNNNYWSDFDKLVKRLNIEEGDKSKFILMLRAVSIMGNILHAHALKRMMKDCDQCICEEKTGDCIDGPHK